MINKLIPLFRGKTMPTVQDRMNAWENKADNYKNKLEDLEARRLNKLEELRAKIAELREAVEAYNKLDIENLDLSLKAVLEEDKKLGREKLDKLIEQEKQLALPSAKEQQLMLNVGKYNNALQQTQVFDTEYVAETDIESAKQIDRSHPYIERHTYGEEGIEDQLACMGRSSIRCQVETKSVGASHTKVNLEVN